MPLLETDHGALAYFDNAPVNADAPTVMLLHSSAASGQQWRKLIQRLTPRYRILAPDLIGYGSTPMLPRPPQMADEVRLLMLLTDRLDGPFHLIGHSYGGAVALELAKAMPQRIASLALYEPVAFNLLRVAGETEAWAEILGVAQRHIALVDAGDLTGAAAAFLDYWIGKGALQAMPLEMRLYVVGKMRKVADEWRMFVDGPPAGAAYNALTMPILLMHGTASTRAARAVAAVLRDLLPRPADWQALEGAAHMAPLTHPDRVNAVLQSFLEGAEEKVAVAG